MSPEQIRSTDDVDARSDIWSLGVVIYELLAGKPAFEAATLEELWTQIKTVPPPPLTGKRTDIPDGLLEILSRCMRKNAADRFQNVAELAIALLPFGPKRARICAERASQVLWSAGMTTTRLRVMSTAPPPYPSDPHATRDSRTSGVAMGSPALSSGRLPALTDEHAGLALPVVPKTNKNRTILAIGGALAAVLLAVVVAVLALRPAAPPPTGTAQNTEAVRGGAVPAPAPNPNPPSPNGATPITPPATAQAQPVVAPTTAPEASPRPSPANGSAAAAAAPVEAPAAAGRPVRPRPWAPAARPAAAAPPAADKPKPKATADEPDLGY
jgi:serine/threonine-protein kinase